MCLCLSLGSQVWGGGGGRGCLCDGEVFMG